MLLFYCFLTDQCPELSCRMASQLCRRKQGRQSKQLPQRQRCLHSYFCCMLNLALKFCAFLQVWRVILPFTLQNHKHTFCIQLLLCANIEISGFLSGSYWIWALNICIKNYFISLFWNVPLQCFCGALGTKWTWMHFWAINQKETHKWRNSLCKTNWTGRDYCVAKLTLAATKDKQWGKKEMRTNFPKGQKR